MNPGKDFDTLHMISDKKIEALVFGHDFAQIKEFHEIVKFLSSLRKKHIHLFVLSDENGPYIVIEIKHGGNYKQALQLEHKIDTLFADMEIVKREKILIIVNPNLRVYQRQ